MRCSECGLYECCMRSPLGGCPNGEKVEQAEIITTTHTDDVAKCELIDYKQAIYDIKEKVMALIKRYQAVPTNGEIQRNFKTARLIGYKDVLHFINKLLNEEET